MRFISAVALGLADAALGIGVLYSDRIDIGRNRVFWLDTGAMVGWLAGGGVGSIIAGDKQRALSIGGALGMTAGIVLSYWATSGSESWRQARQTNNPKVVDQDAPGLRVLKLAAVLCACGVVAISACASQTTFHTVPLGARVQINGALCGESPCVYHTRYGFPDRIHVQLEKDNFECHHQGLWGGSLDVHGIQSLCDSGRYRRIVAAPCL